MPTVPPVRVSFDDLQFIPITAREHGVMLRTLKEFGHRFDAQKGLEIAARLTDSPSTWYFLQRGFGRLVKAGVIARNPIAGVPGPRMQPRQGRIIQPEEFDRILAAARNSEIRFLISAMWMTGLSLVDACFLQWSEVNMEEGVIEKTREKMATRRKGGKCIIPLAPNSPLMEILEARYPVRDEWLGHYPSVNGAHYVDQWSATRYLRGSRGIQDMSCLFKAACQVAGVEGIQFHDFRRTTATRLLQKLDPITVSQVTGHTNLESLKRYIIPDRADLKAKVLEAYGTN